MALAFVSPECSRCERYEIGVKHDFMTNDTQPPADKPQNNVNVTAVFQKHGIPHHVTTTSGFEAKYQLLGRDECEADHYVILWAVRSVILDNALAWRIRAARGKAFLFELPGRSGEREAEAQIVIHRLDQKHIHLSLATEYTEPPTRVLIAERDLDVIRALKLVLSRHSFQLCIARTGAETLDVVQRENFDLALLDVDLPDIDAFVLCARLHAIEPAKNLPVVIVSAWQGAREQAMRAGAIGYLEKPDDFISLPQRLRRFLELIPATTN